MRIIEAAQVDLVRAGEIPKHVACIMDGNGRWAQMRGLPRSAGHAAAETSVDAVVDAALELGVEWLTVYAFSSDNWKRDPDEVSFLMSFHEWLLRAEKRDRFHRLGVRLRFLGRLDDPRIPDSCRNWLRECEQLTKENVKLQFCIAFNYGGRLEIVDAVQSLITSRVAAGDITPDLIQKHCYAADMPDIDLLVRTSAEYRLSDFFPWHTSYAEFVFCDTLWPDFMSWHLYSAVAEYQTRRRRKGAAAVDGAGESDER